jgi:hypothetical protein
MAATQIPVDLVDLQRRSHAAWDAVETYRKDVDAARRAQAAAEGLQTDPTRRRESPQLRPWTEEEEDKFAGLMSAARDAALALRKGIVEAGLAQTYDVAQGLHRAAREA